MSAWEQAKVILLRRQRKRVGAKRERKVPDVGDMQASRASGNSASHVACPGRCWGSCQGPGEPDMAVVMSWEMEYKARVPSPALESWVWRRPSFLVPLPSVDSRMYGSHYSVCQSSWVFQPRYYFTKQNCQVVPMYVNSLILGSAPLWSDFEYY